MTRTRVRLGRLVASVAVILIAANLVAQAASGERPERPRASESVHVVRSGDTLWDIARDLVGPEGDPRPVVADLREVNGLGHRPLPVGARLTLPSA